MHRETILTSLGTPTEKFPGGKAPGGVQESVFPDVPLKFLMHSLHSRDTVYKKEPWAPQGQENLVWVAPEPVSSCVSYVSPRVSSQLQHP